MLDQLTVIIKTIHRPWSCARLIQSLDQHAPCVRIKVLDDSHPDKRFSTAYPVEAKRVNRLIETKFDIGISAGRNRLLATVETPYFLLVDDDHVATAKTDLAGLVEKLHVRREQCDLLAAAQPSQAVPRCFEVIDKQRILRAAESSHEQDGNIFYCDMVPNCFVAKSDAIKEIGWDENLKVHEHWEFFHRGWLQGLRVAITADHSFDHRHISNPAYTHLRNRSWYLRRGLKKHGLRKLEWTSPR